MVMILRGGRTRSLERVQRELRTTRLDAEGQGLDRRGEGGAGGRAWLRGGQGRMPRSMMASERAAACLQWMLTAKIKSSAPVMCE